MQKRERWKEKRDELLLPKLQITLLGNQEALIEGCKGLVNLEDHCIQLQCGEVVVGFHGTNLRLVSLTEGTATVCGTIVGVDYL